MYLSKEQLVALFVTFERNGHSEEWHLNALKKVRILEHSRTVSFVPENKKTVAPISPFGFKT